MKKLPLCQGWLRLTKGGYLLDLRDATMVCKVLRSELTLLKNYDKGNDCFDMIALTIDILLTIKIYILFRLSHFSFPCSCCRVLFEAGKK